MRYGPSGFKAKKGEVFTGPEPVSCPQSPGTLPSAKQDLANTWEVELGYV